MAKRPDRPRTVLRGQAELSWDRIRRQMLETHEVSEAIGDEIAILRKDDTISPVADLALTLQFCQLRALACIVDALKLMNDNDRDRQEIFTEQLRNLLKDHARDSRSF